MAADFRTIVPLSRGIIVTPQNVTIIPMGFDGYYVYVDSQKTPAYEIIYFNPVSLRVCAILGNQRSLWVGSSSDVACGQLKILITKMEDITQAKYFSDKYARGKLAAVVRQHIQIKR